MSGTGNPNHTEDDDGWKEVRYGKNKNTGSHGGYRGIVHGNNGGSNSNLNPNPNPNSKILHRMSMTFYITNFPHKITSKDIYNRCSVFGVVSDVFIPNRLSKAGKRFGFIRFIKVGNGQKLLQDLRSAWFGNYKLYADIERFGRNSQRAPSMEKRNGEDKSEKASPPSMVQPQKTYAEVLSKDTVTKDTANFSKIAPAAQDTEDKFLRVLDIPAPERSFTAIMAARRLTLEDVEEEIVKNDKPSPAPSSSYRAKLRPQLGKKRRNLEPICVDDSQTILSFDETSKNLAQAVEQVNDSHKLALSECQEDHVKEMNKLKGEYALELTRIKRDHASGVDLLVKEFKEKQAQEITDLRSSLLKDVGQLVLEAKIKLAKETEGKGLDVSLWDVTGWKNRLVELGGKVPEDEEKGDEGG